jgi:hypothetical protein
MFRRVVDSYYYGSGSRSIKLTLECGHDAFRKASQGIPMRVQCRDCKHLAAGGTITRGDVTERLAKDDTITYEKVNEGF